MARVSSTVTKPIRRKANPRPRKYASASERQAAYRARAPEVCFRAEPKTVETLDRIAETLDQSRADVLLSMTKFALANHDWARFGLTHKPLPFEYGVNPIMDDDVQKVGIFNVRYVRKGEQLGPRNKSGKTIGPAAEPVVEFYDSRYPHTKRGQFVSAYYARTLNEAPWGEGLILDTGSPDWQIDRDQLLEVKRMIATSGDFGPVIKRKTNPMKTTRAKRKPTPAQLAARERFAEMARSGAFKKAGAAKRKKNPTATSDLDAWMNEYRQLEDINAHSENVVRLADLVGTKADQSAAREILERQQRVGFLQPADYEKRSKLNAKLWPKLMRLMNVRKTNPTKKTVSQKIIQLTREGYPQKQAVAIALNEERAGKVKRNPAADYGYSVDMEGPGKSGLFVTKAVFKTAPDAKQYARALAKMYPSRTIRVMSGGRWLKKP